jgi:putative membrane protein
MPSEATSSGRAVPSGAGRLHPWSWLFTLLGYLRQFLLPLLVLLIFGGGEWWQWIGLAAAPLLITASVIYALTFRYWLEGDALVIRSGVLVRQRRVLPLRRIQNIGRRQSLLHRLFGVAELQIESAGGVTTEAHMRVLAVADAERFERLVRERSDVEEAGPASPLLQLPAAELVRLGLISNRGMVVVAAGFGVLAQTGDGLARAIRPLAALAERTFARVLGEHALDLTAAVVGGVLLVLLVVVGLRLLSVLLALLVFHDFRLSAANGRLSAEYGLLTRVRTSATRAKIQSAWIEESLLHRLFGRVSLRVEVAGSEAPNEGEGRRMRWLAPICTPADAARLLQEVVPGLVLASLEWRPVHRSAARRRFMRAALALLLPVALLSALHSPWWLLALALLPWLWFAARGWARSSGHALDARVFAVRRGWLSRVTVLARRDRAQALSLVQSPFDRRHGTAVLEMDVAGGQMAARLRLPFMAEDEALAVYRALGRLPRADAAPA